MHERLQNGEQPTTSKAFSIQTGLSFSLSRRRRLIAFNYGFVECSHHPSERRSQRFNIFSSWGRRVSLKAFSSPSLL
jgi:hypothetical protein